MLDCTHQCTMVTCTKLVLLSILCKCVQNLHDFSVLEFRQGQLVPQPEQCQSSLQGRVIVTSKVSNYNSVTIQWLPPCDVSNQPLKTILKYSYKKRFRRVVTRKTVSCRIWTVENLDSGVEVEFSLKAIDSQGKKGPKTHEIIRTLDVEVCVYNHHNAVFLTISFIVCINTCCLNVHMQLMLLSILCNVFRNSMIMTFWNQYKEKVYPTQNNVSPLFQAELLLPRKFQIITV